MKWKGSFLHGAANDFLEVWMVKWEHVRYQGDDKVACKVRCPGRRQGEMPRVMMR